MAKNQKYYVADKFRKNHLSKVESSVRAEVTINGVTKGYTNIHFPNAFAKKIFRASPSCQSITFFDDSDSSTWTVLNQ